MENQTEENMKNEMETGLIQEFRVFAAQLIYTGFRVCIKLRFRVSSPPRVGATGHSSGLLPLYSLGSSLQYLLDDTFLGIAGA